MKLVSFLAFLNQLKVYHWQTFSYAQHKALGKAYENLDALFDEFVEVYYGKYGKTLTSKVYTFSVDSLNNEADVKKVITSKKRELLQYIRTELLGESDRDLHNIADSIEGELNRLQYLLDLS